MQAEDQPRRKVGILLGAAIFLLPVVFAWVLLRRGYTLLARVLGLGWLVTVLAIIGFQANNAPQQPGPAPTLPSAASEAPKMATHFVAVESAPLFDKPSGTIVNTYYRGQQVTITARQDGWVRVTPLSADPRWMAVSTLSDTKPKDLPQPTLPADLNDPRMAALPKVGEYAHNAEDVVALRKAAANLLNSGQCNQIDDGSKSLRVSGLYYISCGETAHRFFRMRDGEPEFCGRTAEVCQN